MFRLMMVLMLAVLAAGCATTSQPSAVSQLQIKVAQLERKLEEKDQEISDLRDSVDQMSTSSSTDDITIPASSIDDEARSASSSNISSDDDRIIRVSASPKDVQRALKSAGYYDGTIDGKVGQKTKQAIAKFQKDNGLKSDGIIGKQTWNELKVHLE